MRTSYTGDIPSSKRSDVLPRHHGRDREGSTTLSMWSLSQRLLQWWTTKERQGEVMRVRQAEDIKIQLPVQQRHVDPRRYEDHTQRARPPAFTVRANYNARTQTPEETRRQTYTNPQTSYDDRRAAQYHHQTMTPTTTASTYAQWNRQMQQPNTQQHSDPYRSGFDRPNPNVGD